MSGDIKHHVNTNSAKFKQGLAAGLSSSDDKNWQAGNELGQELKAEDEKKGPVYKTSLKKSSTPLFVEASVKDTSEGNKGSLQDEKDEAAE